MTLRLITISCIIFIFVICSPSIFAYSKDPPVHQHITNESHVVWDTIPYEIKQNIGNELRESDITIIQGSEEEDYYDRFLLHFWQPDDPEDGEYDNGLGWDDSSWEKAEHLWRTRVISSYIDGNIEDSYYWLGRVAHLLEDATSVPHVHLDPHPIISYLERYTANNYSVMNNTYNWQGENFEPYYYENLIDGFDWSDIEPDTANHLFRLFWYTAQKTQYWASKDDDANYFYRELDNSPHNWSCSGSGSTNLWGDKYTSCSDFISHDEDLSMDNVEVVANAVIPHAMRATAGLYRLFWDTVHSYSWPTFHHDNQRTGFSLLKGDLKKNNDRTWLKKNIVLKGSSAEDLYSRNSIGDVDDDGNMETIVVVSDQVELDSEIYAVEQNSWWATKKSGYPIKLDAVVMGPVSIGDIDGDDENEMVFGLGESSGVKAYEASPPSLRWTFPLTSRFSEALNGSAAGDVRFTAIEDIDLDGTNEIVFAEYYGKYDWPGHLFILNDDGSYDEEASINVGNGGAEAAVSLANLDGDDYLEIVVPTYYGFQVYDYDGSTLNLKHNNSDGKMRGAVVLYDIDRDNKYELIYTTTTYGCEAGKTCYNRLYVRDSETWNTESGFPVSLGSYDASVTPAVGDIDKDGDAEIVLSVRNSEMSDYGKILCYESNGNAVSACNNFNYGRLIKAAVVSPDIADIDGDGVYEIIFPETSTPRLFVLDVYNNKLDFEFLLPGEVGSAPAIGDLDNDGKAEIALKRAGSPIAFLSVISDFNDQPSISSVSNITAIAGQLVNVNASGEIAATDPDGDNLSYYYGYPFNDSGLWQTDENSTANYSVVIEATDGNLSSYRYVDVIVFDEDTRVQNNFSDGSSSKSLSFSSSENSTIYIKIPKEAQVIYSKVNVRGAAS
ncbi:MAG: hypothetical protein KKF00_14480 [Proteobacteria bacterium]|nr:hypothetical protein [Pseudomonadota bacterium]